MALIRSFVSFGIVGAVATIIQYNVLIILVSTEVAGPVIASAVSFGISAFVNYALNYRFTFRSTRRHLDALPRFALVAVSGLALNTLIMAILVHWFLLHFLLCQIASTVVVLFWNFTLNRIWSFREAASSSTLG